MEGDMNNYYQSYHSTTGPSAAMKHPSSAASDAYSRARQMTSGTGPSGAPISHAAPVSHHQAYSSESMAYGSRAPASGQPHRKPMDSVSSSAPTALPPSMYSYERSNPYEQDKKMHTASRIGMPTESAVSQQHSSMAGYPSRPGHLHEEAPSHQYKYDMHSSGSTVGRTIHGSYSSEDVSVSKMSSYSAAGAPGGMAHPSRDHASINAYERDAYAREQHEPQMRERSSVPQPVSALEKYFSSEEIKQFSEYNRFLVMSSPGQQKKFYESLSPAEFNRFRDYVDFDRNNKPSSNFKAALPPPIPTAAPLPVPTPYDNHSTAYPPSYSFASSFYEEDKMSTGSVGHRPPIHHMKSKYSNSSGSPPPSMAPFMKGMAPYQAPYPEPSYERPVPARDLSAGMARYAEMRKELAHESLRETLPPERSVEYVRSSRSGYRRSRSRSRSSTPESRSRSSRYRRGSPSRHSPSSRREGGFPKHHQGYLDHELRPDRDSHSHSRSRRTRTRSRTRSRSRSPSTREHKRSRISASKDGKDDGRDYKQNQNSTRKLAPKEEHYYLLDSLTKVKKIHKVKLEELEEIKKKDDGKSDSYIYKKVASSVKDIEERIATVERQLELNRKVLGDSFPEVEKAYEEKEKEKKTSLKALRGENKSKSTDDDKVTNDEPTEKKKNELTKDASSTSVVSSASTIEATAETVAKLPKIPKLSAKKASDDTVDGKKIKEEPETTPIKKSASKEEVPKTKSSKGESKSESSSSKDKSDSKASGSRSYSGPITEDEIEQILPFYQYCSLCKNFFESTDEFITHLHREAHLNGLRTSDFLIIKRAEEKLDTQLLTAEQGTSAAAVNGSDKAIENKALETLGSEFLYPCKAFYCDLCAKFLYTTTQTELHLCSEKHVTLYKKYLQKNKDYASKMVSQRKSSFKYSYLIRTLIRMKDKGEDIVTRVSQEMVRRTRAKEKEREKEKQEQSSESGKEQSNNPPVNGSKVVSGVVEKESSSAASKADDKKGAIKKENGDEEDASPQTDDKAAESTENGISEDQVKVKEEDVTVTSINQEDNEEESQSASAQNENEEEEVEEEEEADAEAEDSPETVVEEGDENGNAQNDLEDDLENVKFEEEDYEEIMDLNDSNVMNIMADMSNLFGEDVVDKLLTDQQAANGDEAADQQVNEVVMEDNDGEDTEEEETVPAQNEEEDGSFDVIDEA